jgi:hypothetical protein
MQADEVGRRLFGLAREEGERCGADFSAEQSRNVGEQTETHGVLKSNVQGKEINQGGQRKRLADGLNEKKSGEAFLVPVWRELRAEQRHAMATMTTPAIITSRVSTCVSSHAVAGAMTS